MLRNNSLAADSYMFSVGNKLRDGKSNCLVFWVQESWIIGKSSRDFVSSPELSKKNSFKIALCKCCELEIPSAPHFSCVISSELLTSSSFIPDLEFRLALNKVCCGF